MAKSDIKIAVLGYPGCSAWITAGILEFFAIARAVARSRNCAWNFDCHVVGNSTRSVQGSQGVRFGVRPLSGRYHAVIVPPLWSASRAEFELRVARLRRWVPLVDQAAQSARVIASSCSGAVLLAEAGWLDGYRATTCWWLASWFEARYPGVRLAADRLVVCDRDRWTSAAGTAYLHLCLELIKHFSDADIAAVAGRLALIEPRRGSQSPFLGAASPPSQSHTELVSRAVRHIERRIQHPLRVRAMARELHTTERTLNRQFRQSLGLSPLQFLQSQRIALAKRLMEDHRASIEAVCERCGYSDVSSFRKLFTREVGMTPGEYRLRFAQPRR